MALLIAYVCPDCGRSFSVQSNMRRHARVHTRTDSQADEPDEDEEEEEDVVIVKTYVWLYFLNLHHMF